MTEDRQFDPETVGLTDEERLKYFNAMYEAAVHLCDDMLKIEDMARRVRSFGNLVYCVQKIHERQQEEKKEESDASDDG